MPKRVKPRPARPVPVQLPLFAEAASLARIRPERNEWRFYRMEVWPDLFGRLLLPRRPRRTNHLTPLSRGKWVSRFPEYLGATRHR